MSLPILAQTSDFGSMDTMSKERLNVIRRHPWNLLDCSRITVSPRITSHGGSFHKNTLGKGRIRGGLFCRNQKWLYIFAVFGGDI